MIRTVTFDYWNTLVATADETMYDRRAAAWVGVLTEAGHTVTVEELNDAFRGSWATFQEHWKANRQFLTGDGTRRALELLGLEVQPAVEEQLVDHFGDVANTDELVLADNLVPMLDRLQEEGVRLGIICDVGMTPSPALRANLDRLGVLDRFDHWSFSDEVGVYKPDPAIFEHALEGLGGEAGSAAHVGDLRRTDVAGARASGWTAVRYAGLFDDAESAAADADHVITDHADLPGILLGERV